MNVTLGVLGYLLIGIGLAAITVAGGLWTDEVEESKLTLSLMVVLWPILFVAGVIIFVGALIGTLVQIVGLRRKQNDDNG